MRYVFPEQKSRTIPTENELHFWLSKEPRNRGLKQNVIGATETPPSELSTDDKSLNMETCVPASTVGHPIRRTGVYQECKEQGHSEVKVADLKDSITDANFRKKSLEGGTTLPAPINKPTKSEMFNYQQRCSPCSVSQNSSNVSTQILPCMIHSPSIASANIDHSYAYTGKDENLKFALWLINKLTLFNYIITKPKLTCTPASSDAEQEEESSVVKQKKLSPLNLFCARYLNANIAYSKLYEKQQKKRYNNSRFSRKDTRPNNLRYIANVRQNNKMKKAWKRRRPMQMSKYIPIIRKMKGE